MVRSLKTSHTGFFHQSVRRVPARLAIGASFRKADTEQVYVGSRKMYTRAVQSAPPA
jgi:hypothetical protein